MGDIVRTVVLTSLTEGGVQGPPKTYQGYLDTGASKSVISTRIARELGGSFMTGLDIPIGGYTTRGKLIALQLDSKNCPVHAVIAAVSDELLKLVGLPEVEMIVGQDYMQGGRTCITMREEGEDHVKCMLPTRKKRTAAVPKVAMGEASPPPPPSTPGRGYGYGQILKAH